MKSIFTTTNYDIQPGSPLTTEDLSPLAFGTALVCSLVGRRRGATERRVVSVLTATDGPLAGSSATGSLRPREERRSGGAVRRLRDMSAIWSLLGGAVRVCAALFRASGGRRVHPCGAARRRRASSFGGGIRRYGASSARLSGVQCCLERRGKAVAHRRLEGASGGAFRPRGCVWRRRSLGGSTSM